MANLEEEEKAQRPPVRVSAAMGYTANLGDYEMLRMDFRIEDTQRPGETAPQAFERCFNFVNARLQEKVNAVKQELSEARSRGGY